MRKITHLDQGWKWLLVWNVFYLASKTLVHIKLEVQFERFEDLPAPLCRQRSQTLYWRWWHIYGHSDNTLLLKKTWRITLLTLWHTFIDNWLPKYNPKQMWLQLQKHAGWGEGGDSTWHWKHTINHITLLIYIICFGKVTFSFPLYHFLVW